jgi:hypothetical protein
MTAESFSYLAFGTTLVVLLVVIGAYYFSSKRRDQVEEPKLKMLDDGD